MSAVRRNSESMEMVTVTVVTVKVTVNAVNGKCKHLYFFSPSLLLLTYLCSASVTLTDPHVRCV